MKTDKIFIGDIFSHGDDETKYYNWASKELLFEVGPHLYYSPRLKEKIVDFENDKGFYIQNLRLFNYHFENQDNISRLKLYKYYKAYLANLVSVYDLYLADIVKPIDDNLDIYQEYNIVSGLDSKIKPQKITNYTVLNKDVLLEKRKDLYVRKNQNKEYKDWPTEENLEYVRNIRKVKMPDYIDVIFIPFDKAQKILSKSK